YSLDGSEVLFVAWDNAAGGVAALTI
ncbi:hypothetical protein AVEN_147164-1, partial [Araneus ventricosus]